MLRDRELEDIYNMDEIGIFHRMIPRRTLATKAEGQEKQKERATQAVCANASGNDKLPIMLIGKSENPRCFRGIRKENLGVTYKSN